jgi:hypothetical protein
VETFGYAALIPWFEMQAMLQMQTAEPMLKNSRSHRSRTVLFSLALPLSAMNNVGSKL